jgi:hypothetical protein
MFSRDYYGQMSVRQEIRFIGPCYLVLRGLRSPFHIGCGSEPGDGKTIVGRYLAGLVSALLQVILFIPQERWNPQCYRAVHVSPIVPEGI